MPRKSRRTLEQERERVLAILLTTPDGLRHEQIRRAYADRYGSRIAYAALRNRLGELLAAGVIERAPEHRNPRYWAANGNGRAEGRTTGNHAPPHEPARMSPRPTVSPGGADEAVSEIPLSLPAREAQALVRRPRAQRLPVTYDVAFLESYEPGKTWYLTPALREHLRRIGCTAYANQPAGTYARDIMQRLIIDLSWGSSRLEGNQYSRIDTEELLTAGRTAPGASDRDRQMILNHKAAIEFLVDNAQDIGFDRHTALGLHALLSENLLGNPDDEGTLRVRPIGIGDSVYTPTAIPQVIEAHFRLLLEKAAAVPDPIEQSFFVMVHLPYLQPFIDVNKRTSRLAANIPLIKANLCPLSFVDVPERTYTEGTLAVYELDDVALLRDVFAWAYERSCAQFQVLRQSMGDPDPIRLRYRTELRSLVTDVVRDRVWPDDSDLLARARRYGVPPQDQEKFIATARRDLRVLRPDILARYQLRMGEFDAWVQEADARRQQDVPER